MSLDKRSAAKQLYLADYPQQTIAKILSLSKNTISNWATKEDWKAKKIQTNMLEENSINTLMEIFDYQVRCLKAIKDNNERKGELVAFKPGEFDALQKLYSTIKPDFQKFKLHVTVVRHFLEFIHTHNIDLAKEVIPVMELYINEKRKLI